MVSDLLRQMDNRPSYSEFQLSKTHSNSKVSIVRIELLSIWILSKMSVCLFAFLSSFKMRYNVLQLPEGGDFGALHCQPSRNFDRSTKLDLTTEPPLLGRCCCGQLFYSYSLLYQVSFSQVVSDNFKFVLS